MLNKHPLRSRSLSPLLNVLGLVTHNGFACDLDPEVRDASIAEIKAFFESQDERVFTFVGCSGAGYRYAALSDCVDPVFYVEDATWVGCLAGSERLSPASTAVVESSDTVVGVGGGAVGRDELTAAKRLGKTVRFYSADMNHGIAREKSRKKGLPEPTDFSGAASSAF